MREISFKFMEKGDFSKYAPALFSILHGNMSRIAPTGNSYDEDCAFWRAAFGQSFSECEARKLILIIGLENGIAGYFVYSILDDTFKMEECQIAPEYQGRYGIFRRLYAFALAHLPENLRFVEAYANRQNEKSLAILRRLGLKIVGANKSGSSHHLRGDFQDLLRWLHREE